jgi:hypothetical protein
MSMWHHVMKVYGGEQVSPHRFLMSVQDRDEFSISSIANFWLGDTHSTEGQVDTTTKLNMVVR